MLIRELLISEDAALHVLIRHNLQPHEVEHAALENLGYVHRGRNPGVYVAYGRTEAGRYLMVIVRDLGHGVAQLITARDMSDIQKRRYLRKMMH